MPLTYRRYHIEPRQPYTTVAVNTSTHRDSSHVGVHVTQRPSTTSVVYTTRRHHYPRTTYVHREREHEYCRRTDYWYAKIDRDLHRARHHRYLEGLRLRRRGHDMRAWERSEHSTVYHDLDKEVQRLKWWLSERKRDLLRR